MIKHSIHVLVTGASGFIGSFLCKRLLTEGRNVRGTMLSSKNSTSLVAGVESVIVKSLGAETSWEETLAGIDTVVHLAARVHIMGDLSSNPLEEFRKVNVGGTLKLARDAVNAGVKRFIFISSIKVNGEESPVAYTEKSGSNPQDAYAISKWEAEQILHQIAAETGMEIVIIRPPLVYGPGVKANFLQLLNIVTRGIPLPFAGVCNRRSLIFVENLVDAIIACIERPEAAGTNLLG